MTSTQDPYYQRAEVAAEPTPLAPPVVAPVVHERIVVPATPAAARHVQTASAVQFSPDAVVAAVVGLVLLITGLIVVVRAGLDGPLSQPVVSVLGFAHTATLGVVEVLAGVCLLASGAARSRGAAMFFGLAVAVAGFVGAVQTSSFSTSLALESAWAWWCVVAGAIVVLAALLLPRFARSSTVVERR